MSSKAADAIEARGFARGLEKATMKYTISVVNNMVKKFNISLNEACEVANITVDDYKKYSVV
ncbi:hypothetical protein [Eubacterium ramulus]|uniref:hypothetical protein n=1 Tax=Eubacterium ramulus TaxID=39490 RepID=UPI0022E6E14C|nr:hypothetical protein [Eubacterium ramulus]